MRTHRAPGLGINFLEKFSGTGAMEEKAQSEAASDFWSWVFLGVVFWGRAGLSRETWAWCLKVFFFGGGLRKKKRPPPWNVPFGGFTIYRP